MVPMYQKYCDSCVEQRGLPQDETWHKNNQLDDWENERLRIVKSDMMRMAVQELKEREAVTVPTEQFPHGQMLNPPRGNKGGWRRRTRNNRPKNGKGQRPI